MISTPSRSTVWLRALVVIVCLIYPDVAAQGVEGDDVGTRSGNHLIPPIFVLNMDRSLKRWETAKAVMEGAGLEVQRFPAVDGRLLSKEELLRESTKIATFFQPRGVIGCYLSHKRFWKMIVDNDLPAAIVFEDDVELVDGFKEKLQYNLERLTAEDSKSQEYDVIMLGAIGRAHPQGQDAIGSLFSLTTSEASGL